MLVSHLTFVLAWAMGLSFVAAGIAPLDSNLQIRNAPGTLSSDTLWALRRSLSAAAMKRDTVFQNSTSLDKSWNGAVLFSYVTGKQNGNTALSASVEIVCTTCYIKGTATAQFTIEKNFNISQAFQNITSQVKTKFSNITTAAVDYVEGIVDKYIDTNLQNMSINSLLHVNALDFPPLEIDFDMNLPDIPESRLRFQFDHMELYMQIDTILSGGATYTLNLYTSSTPIGFAVGPDLLMGIVFSVDLILSVEAEIDISSGFHIKLNDGVAIDLSMFDHNVSSITFNGGNFEFLPVTIQSAGVVLSALLRIGVKAGLQLSTPTVSVQGFDLDFSAGLESGVWADVAQFVTNVTAVPPGSGSICELHVIEEYSMLIGANAGATLAIGENTWGPTPSTQIPIWYTTMRDACAVVRNATVLTSTAAPTTIVARADLTTTTITTKVTYTAVLCNATGLVNCPVSLQTISKNTVTKTLITAVPSGSKATFPATTQITKVNTIAFGKNVQKMGSATSGSPVSYVPTTSSQSSTTIIGPTSDAPKGDTGSVLKGETAGVNNKVIIGVSVGVGLPVLIAIIAGCIYLFRRRRYTPVQIAESPDIAQQTLQTAEPYTLGSYMSNKKKSPNVTVEENNWPS